MAVDFSLPYGADMSWTIQGAPVLVTDLPNSAAATQQQVAVLVLTSPRLLDVNGVGMGRPDNLFYPDRGGGLRAIVGANPLPQYLNAMQARILRALATSSGVASSPLPQVTTSSAVGVLTVLVTCYAASGDLIQVAQSSGG